MSTACHACSAPLGVSVRFCENCGSPVAAAPGTPLPIARPQPPTPVPAPATTYRIDGQSSAPTAWSDDPRSTGGSTELAFVGPGPKRASMRRGNLVAIITTVALVLAGGGTAAALVLPRVLPAGSATAAAQKLLTSATKLDVLGLATSIAPSEVPMLQSSLNTLQSAQIDSDGTTVAADIKKIKASLHVTTSGLHFTEQAIDDDVARVTLDGGTITLDGDPRAVAAALADLAWSVDGAQLAAQGNAQSDLAQRRKELTSRLVDTIKLPYVVDARSIQQANHGDQAGLSVVSVHEGRGWYVSPLLSVADQAMWSAQHRQPRTGTVPVAKVASTPTAAVQQTVNAALDTTAADYWGNLAATLPLPERRVIGLYGGQQRSPWQDSNDHLHASVSELRFDTAQPSGNQTLLSGWHAKIAYQDYEDAGTIAVDSWCLNRSSDASSNDSACAQDVLGTAFDKLGLGQLKLVVLKEKGGWQFSAVSTVGMALSIVSTNLTQLSKDGHLSDLFSTGHDD